MKVGTIGHVDVGAERLRGNLSRQSVSLSADSRCRLVKFGVASGSVVAGGDGDSVSSDCALYPPIGAVRIRDYPELFVGVRVCDDDPSVVRRNDVRSRYYR
jgi:hypothetical protein